MMGIFTIDRYNLLINYDAMAIIYPAITLWYDYV